jgi:type IV secretion system protein VirB5
MASLKIIVTLALASASGSSTAWAQAGPGIPTFDVSTYAQTLATVKNTLAAVEQAKAQVAEAQRLYASMNKLTNVNGIATVLNDSAVRNVLPAEARDMTKLMSGDLSSTGAVGDRAKTILDQYRVDVGLSSSDADQGYQAAIDRTNGQAATQAAIADTAYDVANQRTRGLEELRTSLDSATDAKEVMDLQARIAAENAHIANDQMKLQSIAMREQAAQTLKIQQDTQTNLKTRLVALGANQ